jgi:hypothetical protein
MTAHRSLASALAALGAVSAVPLALAQLDFAGVLNAFDIHAGDAPHAVLVPAGVSGALTCVVAIAALVGAALAMTGSHSARGVLVAVAVAGLVSATILWIPTGLAIGAAAVLLSVEQTAAPRAA